jgi:3'-phosphoadenosine 5'-phosphosulfate sulfotransferase (PAPS reductase)/FAD synthetase
MSQNRIREWYEHYDGDVYVSFSGGKDSTVLAHLVHDLYPKVPLVFANTGLEYPEIQAFARKMNAEFVRPKSIFSEVISKFGYPIISKEVAGSIYYARRIRGALETKRRRSQINSGRREQMLGETVTKLFDKRKWLPLCQEAQFMIGANCCDQIKKEPMKKYQKQTHFYPIIGTLAEESKMRENSWLKNGCNAFESKKPISQPMSFWTEQDVLHYIKDNGIEIASVYGEVLAMDDGGFTYEPMQGVDCKLKCTGCQRTGCIFCGFGAHHDKGETRFQRLAKTHPRQYEYCMDGGQWVDNPAFDPSAPAYDGEWKNWNPKKIWVPSKEGLGMKKVFDDCNQIYGKDFIRYE